MVEEIQYWTYHKSIGGYKCVDIICGFKELLNISSTEIMVTDDIKIINYIKSNIKRLIEGRGYTLENCAIKINIKYRGYFCYMPCGEDMFDINFYDNKNINDIELEVSKKIIELLREIKRK